MKEHGIYFGKSYFFDLVRAVGGVWNDSKERPLVCLVKSIENENLYWAIPMGNLNHRDEKSKERIQKFLSYDESDIRSCFYHIGNTDVTSLFFISDAIPITDKYIEREYKGKYTGEPYVIKNKVLLSELKRKLGRILTWENTSPNYFRQHITDVKGYLLDELSNNKEKEHITPFPTQSPH